MDGVAQEDAKDGSLPGPPATRHRKAHRKSRLGCKNCKLRRIKCDEAKPNCRQCVASHFTCSYIRSADTLQLQHTHAFQINFHFDPLLHPRRPAFHIPITTPLDGRIDSYELKPRDMAVLSRFRERTVWTLPDARVKDYYGARTVSLGDTSPFLLHIFIAMTLLHEVHVGQTPISSSYKSTIAFHLYHATSIFGRKICEPIPESHLDLDALCVASAMLGAASFSHIDVTSPEEAWPLKEPDPTDLDWLGMSEGKHVFLAALIPYRPGTLFYELSKSLYTPVTKIDTTDPVPPDNLPADLYALLGLDGESNPETNPYHTAAFVLARLWPRPITTHALGDCLEMAWSVGRSFRALLLDKDERALLVLAYWFAKICTHSSWWIQKRSLLEGSAICIYLGRECTDARILRLLEHPRSLLQEARRARYDESQGTNIYQQVVI